MNPQIKHRYTGAVLFEGDAGMTMRQMLEKATALGAYLTGAYLMDAVLTGADLRGANLMDANLTGANLTGAYLMDAVLTGADLTGANLMDAVLTGANLMDAVLTGADLTGADLTGANLMDAVLTGADLRDADGNSLRATDAESIEALDKVRAIILDDAARLQMDTWHEASGWKNRTCAEEAACGTTHCLAGWLQVCSTKPGIREMDAHLAGVLSAPIAAKMFFKQSSDVLPWLESRAYVQEIAESTT